MLSVLFIMRNHLCSIMHQSAVSMMFKDLLEFYLQNMFLLKFYIISPRFCNRFRRFGNFIILFFNNCKITITSYINCSIFTGVSHEIFNLHFIIFPCMLTAQFSATTHVLIIDPTQSRTPRCPAHCRGISIKLHLKL